MLKSEIENILLNFNCGTIGYDKATLAILSAIDEAINIKPKQLHDWYLEATAKLDPDSYNSKAQVDYEFLSSDQQYIDEYIADKIEQDLRTKLGLEK